MNTSAYLLAALVSAAPAAYAGSFAVNPIRLDFDATAKTGTITVSNDDEVPLSFQMKLVQWTQNAMGEDAFTDSNELIFFPQIMTLAPKEKRLIRVGTKTPPMADERTYRLFISELPEAQDATGKGAQVAIKLRFGVPLFVAPAKPDVSGSIEDVKLANGEIQLRVRNTGNQHFRFETIAAKAAGAQIGEVPGWYLLPGAARAYSIKVDPAACAKTDKLELSINADGLGLKRELDASPRLCGP